MPLDELMTITDGRTESEVAALLHALYPTAANSVLLATADLIMQYRSTTQRHPVSAGFLERLLAQRLVYLQRHT